MTVPLILARTAGSVDDCLAAGGAPSRRRTRRCGAAAGNSSDPRGRHERVGVLLALAERRAPRLPPAFRRQRLQRLAPGDGARHRKRPRSARQLHRLHVPGSTAADR